MNNLSQRLSQLRKQSGSQIKPASELVNHHSFATTLTQKLKFSQASSRSSSKSFDTDIAKLINGEVLKPGLILVRSTIKLSHLHSQYDARFSRPLHYLSSNVEIENCVFIDTETTGLSSAAGTLVFLLGMASISKQTLVLEQILLTRIGAEKHMLDWFNNKCADKTHFVSYNGKSFDIPLLDNRFKMNKIKRHFCQNHIDLLHWVRRLHQSKLSDCRLPSAEVYCLQFSRNNDLPGSEAPSVWRDLIRYGRIERLKSLMQHHAWDIISLVGLLHHTEASLHCEKNALLDHLSTARYFIENKKSDIGKKILTENFHNLQPNALFLLSEIYRREKKWIGSVKIWKKLVSTPYLPAIECLAKYYEHVDKNITIALQYTNLLISYEGEFKHQKRIDRLNRKLNNLQF